MTQGRAHAVDRFTELRMRLVKLPHRPDQRVREVQAF